MPELRKPGGFSWSLDGLGWPLAVAVVVVLAILLMSPVLPVGIGWNDSYVFNTIWMREFNAALARGEVSPRWLPGAFEGLGASSFYFYPPLVFYIAGGVNAVSGGSLNTDQLAAWSAVVMLGLSGLAMYAWLRGQVGRFAALLGAALYMATPYHLILIYLRGAFAEFSAYVILPLCMLALAKAASSVRWIPLLALCYALLICAHIGSALLVSLTAVPVYVLYLARRVPPAGRARLIARCLAGGVLGLAMAAFYLAPALLMQKGAQIEWMWAGYAPETWTLLNPALWPVRPFADAMALIGWASGGACAVAILATAKRIGATPQALIWGAVGLICLALYAVPVPWVAPGVGALLKTVQYPWRILIVMEFAAVTALCLAAMSGRRLVLLLLAPLTIWPVIEALKLMKPAYMFSIAQAARPPWAKTLVDIGMAPEEHLPAGFTAHREAAPVEVSRIRRAFPLAQPVDGQATILSATSGPDGNVRLEVDAAEPTRVALRRFYFTSWRIQQVATSSTLDVTASPFGPEQRLSFIAEPGRRTYRVRIVRTALERFADLVSALSLFLGAAIALHPSVWRLRRPS